MEKTCSVLPRTLTLQWYEAVALVCAVADAVEHGRLRAVPQIGELALASDGSVQAVGDGSSGTALGRFPAEAAVVDLRRLLGELLDSGGPPELKRLSAEQDGAGSIAEFRRELGFFERPSKEKDLRALAARVAEADDKAHLEAELDRLTREARNVQHLQDAPSPPAVVRATGLRRGLIVVAGIAAGAAALATILVLAMHGGAGPAAMPSAVQGRSEAGFLQEVRDRVRSAFATEPSQTKEMTAVSASAAHSEHERTRRRVDRVTARTLDIAETTREPLRVTEPAIAVLPSSRTWRMDIPPLPVRASRTLYDRGNSEVIAATLLRPQLPAVDLPDLARNQLGRVMVVVDEQGRVEQVRLLTTTPERRYYDAMILAAIKAWIFNPATRGGQPVRYRLVLPLT